MKRTEWCACFISPREIKFPSGKPPTKFPILWDPGRGARGSAGCRHCSLLFALYSHIVPQKENHQKNSGGWRFIAILVEIVCLFNIFATLQPVWLEFLMSLRTQRESGYETHNGNTPLHQELYIEFA